MSDNLEQVARLVTQAVTERLGEVRGDVLEVVVREVVSAMSGAREVPASSTPAPPALPDCGAAPGITTPRGSVVPRAPTGGAASDLEICQRCLDQERSRSDNRAVITTTGSNTTGVVAAVSAEIAEAGGDIQDMSQTIVAGFFTMIMVVDLGGLTLPFDQFQERLMARAQQLGIHAVVMHESVLQALQRV